MDGYLMFTLQQLIESIKSVYTNTETYEMHKSVIDFHTVDGEYIGDYFNLFIQERVESQPPKIYHIGGPFDLISNKAPQRVVCYQGGALLLNKDITHEVDIRTAAMNFVVYSSLGIKRLGDKKILIIGTGKIAREFLKQLKEYDTSVTRIDYNNHNGIDVAFEQLGKDLSIDCNFVPVENLGIYDLIILHTSSRDPILTKELFKTLKPSVIISTFAGSHTGGEVEGAYYTNNTQLIVDREQTLQNAKEINKQISEGTIDKGSIAFLENIITGEKKMTFDKPIIYRSTGAPMQTLAIVKLLS